MFLILRNQEVHNKLIKEIYQQNKRQILGEFITITKTDYLLQNIWGFAISIQLHPK